MPRRKRTTRSNKNDSVMSIRSDANSTLMSVKENDSSLASLNLNESQTSMWYSNIEEKLLAGKMKLEDTFVVQLEKLDVELNTILLKLPNILLNKIVDMNDEKLHKALSSFACAAVDSDSSEPSDCSPIVPTTVKKNKRSRSVKEESVSKAEMQREVEAARRTTRVRSSSVSYQTPKNRARLSTFTTAKKYTVSKPKKVEDTGVNMKRYMRPDEEAISTSGSPLFVQRAVTSIPHVNIPLPGEIVLNIEPKRPRGRLDIPDLDENTKKQIKILCEQLKNIISD